MVTVCSSFLIRKLGKLCVAVARALARLWASRGKVSSPGNYYFNVVTRVGSPGHDTYGVSLRPQQVCSQLATATCTPACCSSKLEGCSYTGALSQYRNSPKCCRHKQPYDSYSCQSSNTSAAAASLCCCNTTALQVYLAYLSSSIQGNLQPLFHLLHSFSFDSSAHARFGWRGAITVRSLRASSHPMVQCASDSRVAVISPQCSCCADKIRT